MQVYKYIQILSLDVAVGGVFMAIFIGKVHEVQSTPITLASLGLAIWIIYTYDHLQDARKISHVANTERHRFHQKYFKVLRAILVIACASILILITQLPNKLIIYGLGLLLPVGLYFLILLKTRGIRFKEIWVGLGYSLGVFLPTMVWLDFGQLNFILFAQVSLLAIGNLLIFSVYENEADKKDGGAGLVQSWGVSRVRILTNMILVLAPVLSFIGLFNSGTFLVAGAMTTILLIINNIPKLFNKNERYRTFGDAVFFIPVFYWLV